MIYNIALLKDTWIIKPTIVLLAFSTWTTQATLMKANEPEASFSVDWIPSIHVTVLILLYMNKQCIVYLLLSFYLQTYFIA